MLDVNNKRTLTIKKTQFSTSLIAASCICILAQFYALPHQLEVLTMLSNRCLLVLWIIITGVLVVRRLASPVSKSFVSALVLIIFACLSVFMAAMEDLGSLGNNAKDLIGFFSLIMMLMYSASYEIKNAKPIVLCANIVASLIFISLYYSDLRHSYVTVYGVKYIDVVTLGYSNPNLTAIYLFVCIINLFVAIFYFKHWLLKVLLALDLTQILFILYKTESRTAILLIVVFIILFICSLFYKMPRIFPGIAIALPIAYALMAQYLFPFFGEITFRGETIFNGREDIFSRYFDNINLSNFLFGDFNQFRFDNLHNGYVSIAATLGVPALICFLIFLKENVYKNYRQIEFAKYESVAFWGFICIIMYACTEASLFVSSASYGFLIFSVYLLFAKPYAAIQTTQ